MTGSKFVYPPSHVNTGFNATYGPGGTVAGTGASTWQWVKLSAVSAESSSWFSIANGRYTPQLPGWYLLTLNIHADAVMTFDDNVLWQVGLKKNDVIHKAMTGTHHNKSGQVPRAGGSAVVWANGTTDYFMPAFFHNDSVGHSVSSTVDHTWFTGARLGL